MRILALMLGACAAATLNWSGPAHSAVAPKSSVEQLPHISVRSVGRGTPVVLIPGLSTPRDVWDGVAPVAERGRRLILVQVNGFGGDEPGANLKGAVLDGVVADLHAYLASHKVSKVRVIGHSVGGLLALQLARAHPDDVERLMIVDALPYVGDIFVPGATVAQLEPQAKAMREQMVASFGKSDAATAKRTAASLALTPNAEAQVAAWVGRADSRVAGEVMYEALTTDLRPDMANIATPITLIYPYSAALPKERADAFYRAEYKAAPHVRFVGIGEAGHFVMLDRPQEFAAAVAEFLK